MVHRCEQHEPCLLQLSEMSLSIKHFWLRVVYLWLKWNRVMAVLWRFLSGRIYLHLSGLGYTNSFCADFIENIARLLKQNVIKVDNDQGPAVSHHWQGTVKYRCKSMKGSSIDDQPCRIFVLFTCLARFEPRPPQFATKGTRARCRSWHNIHIQKSLHYNDLLPATATVLGPGGRSIHSFLY